MEEAHSWLIFTPGSEERHRHVSLLYIAAQELRLCYRGVVAAGLRNPETGFNPADYFGYMLPTKIGSNPLNGPEEHRTAFTFGLMHIDRKLDHFPPDEKFDHTKVDGYRLRKASLRWIAYDAESLVKAADRFPIKVRHYKSWEGHERLISGLLEYRSHGQFTHRTLNFLLQPPGFSEQEVEQTAANLIKKLRSGGN